MMKELHMAIEGNQAKQADTNASQVNVYIKQEGLIFKREEVEGWLRSMARHFPTNKVVNIDHLEHVIIL